MAVSISYVISVLEIVGCHSYEPIDRCTTWRKEVNLYQFCLGLSILYHMLIILFVYHKCVVNTDNQIFYRNFRPKYFYSIFICIINS